MKTKLQLLITFLMVFKIDVLFCQSTSFPEENAIWSKYCEFEGFIDSDTFQQLEGDSIYNGIEYQKISFSNDFFSSDNSGLTRVDNEAVYFIPKDSLNEVLLYDFNLQVGDTFHIDPYFQITNINFVTVIEIDSIMTNDGINRKVFHFSEGTNWIEGIGALYGSTTFPWYFLSLSGDCHLYCYSENSMDVYEKQYYEFIDYDVFVYGCSGLVSSNSNVENKLKLSVYPNPFDDEIVIKSNLNEIELLRLYDSKFSIVAQNKNMKRLKLNSSITSGFYILEIIINGEKYYKKVIRK